MVEMLPAPFSEALAKLPPTIYKTRKSRTRDCNFDPVGLEKKLKEPEITRICGMCQFCKGSPKCSDNFYGEHNPLASYCKKFKFRKENINNGEKIEDGRSSRLFLLYLCIKYPHRYFAENKGREDRGIIYVFNGRYWASNFEKTLLPKEVANIYGDTDKMPNLSEVITKFKGKTTTEPPPKLPPQLIPFQNGIYDIMQNVVLYHKSDYFYTVEDVIPIEFNPRADFPYCLDFLENKVIIKPFQTFHRVMGSILWRGGMTPFLLIILGGSQTGKTTFREMFIRVFSDSPVPLVRTLSLTELNEDVPEVAGRIKGCIVNWGDENGTVFKNVDTLKRRVCNATEETRRLYENATSEIIHCKFINDANEVPTFFDDNGNAAGFNNRLHIVIWERKGDFQSTIEGLPFEEYWKNMAYSERQGFINWMLDGLYELMTSDWMLSTKEEHDAMIQLYQDCVSKKPVVEFFNTSFIQNYNPTSVVNKHVMYEMYLIWHKASKKDGCPLTFYKFCRRIKAELDLEDDRTHKVWIGVGLLPHTSTP